MATRILNLTRGRLYQTTTDDVVGSTFLASRVTATTLGGWYALPLQLPPDLDTKRPCSIYVPVATAAVTPDNGKAIVWRWNVEWLNTDGSLTNVQVDQSWTVPDDWAPNDVRVLTLDAGAGFAIPAEALPPQTTLGFRFARLGSGAGDTYDRTAQLIWSAALAYTSKYPWLVNPNLP